MRQHAALAAARYSPFAATIPLCGRADDCERERGAAGNVEAGRRQGMGSVKVVVPPEAQTALSKLPNFRSLSCARKASLFTNT